MSRVPTAFAIRQSEFESCFNDDADAETQAALLREYGEMLLIEALVLAEREANERHDDDDDGGEASNNLDDSVSVSLESRALRDRAREAFDKAAGECPRAQCV